MLRAWRERRILLAAFGAPLAYGMHGGRGCVREPGGGCSPIASLLFVVRIILGVRVERRRVSPQRCGRLWHRVSMKAKLEKTRNGQAGQEQTENIMRTRNSHLQLHFSACLGRLSAFDVFDLHSHLPPGSASQHSTHSALTAKIEKYSRWVL